MADTVIPVAVVMPPRVTFNCEVAVVGDRISVPVQVIVPANKHTWVVAVVPTTVMFDAPDKVATYPVMFREFRLFVATLTMQLGEAAPKITSSPAAGTEATGDQLLAVPQLLSVPPAMNVLDAIYFSLCERGRNLTYIHGHACTGNNCRCLKRLILWRRG